MPNPYDSGDFGDDDLVEEHPLDRAWRLYAKTRTMLALRVLILEANLEKNRRLANNLAAFNEDEEKP